MLTAGRTRHTAALLGSSQVIAEVAGCDTEGKRISGSRIEHSPGRKASGDEQRQLLNLRIGCDGDGAEDSKAAVAARLTEWNKDLIEESEEAPASAHPCAGVEI